MGGVANGLEKKKRCQKGTTTMLTDGAHLEEDGGERRDGCVGDAVVRGESVSGLEG